IGIDDNAGHVHGNRHFHPATVAAARDVRADRGRAGADDLAADPDSTRERRRGIGDPRPARRVGGNGGTGRAVSVEDAAAAAVRVDVEGAGDCRVRAPALGRRRAGRLRYGNLLRLPDGRGAGTAGGAVGLRARAVFPGGGRSMASPGAGAGTGADVTVLTRRSLAGPYRDTTTPRFPQPKTRTGAIDRLADHQAAARPAGSGDDARATATAPAANRSRDERSVAASHTASATSVGRVTAVSRPKPSNTLA